MKILVSWLRELVDVPATIPDLGSALHMRGFELAGIEPKPGGGGTDDAVIDVEITANRPDCLSMHGIAREVAATYRRPLAALAPLAPLDPRQTPDGLSVALEDARRCPRYAAAVADVKIGASPAWLADRLQAVGVRPVNNVVDATNYVMLEMGQPMHAFDLERLGGRTLRIRTAADGERIRTLDGTARTLAADMLVIADAERAQAVAGVMGGADSEVSGGTRTVALESAYFDPASVRRTSKRLGLSTEASHRFERGADIEAPVLALRRLCALLEQIGAGHARPGVVDAFPAPPARRTVTLRRERIATTLGLTIGDPDVAEILSRLGFELAAAAHGWSVIVPSWRVDVFAEVDLIEELARHHGYDQIPTTFPALKAAPRAPDPFLDAIRQARRASAALGFSEAITFAFTDRPAALPFAGDEGDLVAIANPLSEKFTVMRPSVLPGLVDSLVHNRRREQRDVRLYEIGSVFTRSGGEGRRLALAWTGSAAGGVHWSGSRDADFFDMRGLVEAIGAAFDMALDAPAGGAAFLAPGSAARMIGRPARPSGTVYAGVDVGHFGRLVPAIAQARGWRWDEAIYVADMDLRALAAYWDPRENVAVRPLARFPSVSRDISILVEESLPAGTVRGTIRSAAPADLLESIREFDRYRGKGIPEGSVSLSLRVTFRAADRTLTEAEVQRAMDGIVEALRSAHGARQR